MLSLAAPRRVALRATLERLETVPDGFPKVPESLGRVELPVFTELFPAGSTAVAGDVSLSALECASGPEARRRVNLTLFNAGTETATFGVSANSVMTASRRRQPASSSTKSRRSPSSSSTRSRSQGLPVCDAGGAWFRITGDQPFLAYISTVRPENLAGVLPLRGSSPRAPTADPSARRVPPRPLAPHGGRRPRSPSSFRRARWQKRLRLRDA